ncbi:MAG: hypothetical protein BWX87_01739 [Bacteroidetes bacterium ADurb.Bin123]|nr:MAG: hypothetical protein BWX87_01739 [Bacteroidetes bacterium ADurb.Bin123]
MFLIILIPCHQNHLWSYMKTAMTKSMQYSKPVKFCQVSISGSKNTH